jgi:hypothetical protein
VEVYPSYEEQALRIELFGDDVDALTTFDPLTGKSGRKHDKVAIYPKTHFVAPRDQTRSAVESIKAELIERRTELESLGKVLEAQRLHQRTMFDLEMMKRSATATGWRTTRATSAAGLRRSRPRRCSTICRTRASGCRRAIRRYRRFVACCRATVAQDDARRDSVPAHRRSTTGR